MQFNPHRAPYLLASIARSSIAFVLQDSFDDPSQIFIQLLQLSFKIHSLLEPFLDSFCCFASVSLQLLPLLSTAPLQEVPGPIAHTQKVIQASPILFYNFLVHPASTFR